MKTPTLLLLLASPVIAQTNIFVVPERSTITITIHTNPYPPMPLSVQQRQRPIAPSQNLIVTKVEPVVTIQHDFDSSGAPTGRTDPVTNYLITLTPIEGISVWGMTNTRQIRLWTTWPVKENDRISITKGEK